MPELLPKILGIIANWGRWFENISIRVLEWLVILIGCKIKGINGLEASEYKNS